MEMEKNKWHVKRIVLLGLLMAFNMVATYIHVPVGGSMMHLGTTALFITALILDPVDAAIASGGGMFLFDIFGGYVTYAPFTLVIKGLMAYIVSKLVHKSGEGLSLKVNLGAYVIGGIVSLVGYYFTNVFFTGSFIGPISKIPGSILTTTIGILIALPLGIQVKKAYLKI
ncbi:MAG: ECF transporter S component [Anaeromicrobium sp.]|jgi:uncharacterized membrane protein|uniref:ECF transporter S component n=1 Tax=Anaeromicrobium sp. TaxID=1929132 RepID=UPI0025FBFDF8|nr:ECF transporter S component [Anaeromicrobium sp.]MCT4593397.1 ECF transporter S component [Anaeromicrobium sp.]